MMSRPFRTASLLLVLSLLPRATLEAQSSQLEVTSPEEPGTPVELVAYFPERVGDSWRFVDLVDPEAALTRVATDDSEPSGLRIDGSDGVIRHRTVDAADGLVWTEETLLGGRRLVYVEGHRLLPGQVETGATYVGESRYQTLLDEQVSASGVVRSTVEVLDLETVELAAGAFEDCLVLDVELVFVPDGEDGEPSERRLRLWRARGVGPVREVASGQEAPFEGDDERLEWLLVEASVSGTLLPADADRRPSIDLGPFEPPRRPIGE